MRIITSNSPSNRGEFSLISANTWSNLGLMEKCRIEIRTVSTEDSSLNLIGGRK